LGCKILKKGRAPPILPEGERNVEDYAIKDEKWYADEVSDTTMMTIAVSLLGQKESRHKI
jgi:hypothetical protein